MAGEKLELTLEAFSLVDVLGLTKPVERFSVGAANERGGQENPDHAAVGGEPSLLALVALGVARDEPLDRAGVLLRVGRVKVRARLAAEELSGGVAAQLTERGVDLRVAAALGTVEADEPHRDRRLVECAVELTRSWMARP